MKKTKVILVCALVAVLLMTCLTGCDFIKNLFQKEEEPKPFTIGIISDCQIVAESDVGDDAYLSFQDLNEVGQKMLFISEAILETAVDRLIEQKVDVVLIPGDMTENGSKQGHEVTARECQRLLDAGIPTYVICGNHDINKNPKKFYGSVQDALADGNYETQEEAEAHGYTKTNYIKEVFSDGSCSVATSGVTPADFTSIYYNFGFNGAVALDTLVEPYTNYIESEDYTFEEVGTMSYVQDLAGSNYRLIAVDASNYYEDENEDTYYMTKYGNNDEYDIKGTGYSAMTDRLLAWTETQLKQAKADGKQPLVMVHFPVNGQMGSVIDSIDIGDNKLNMQKDFQFLLTEYDVQYVFTGHLHTQHSATYTNELSGKVLTDIETGCLTNYALPIRYFTTATDGTVTVTNEYLPAVKAEYIPSYVDEETKQKVTTDIQSYALDFIYYNLLHNFDLKINGEEEQYELFYDIFEMLGLDDAEERSENARLADLASYVYNDIYYAFLTMPINDKGDGKVSVESLCKNYVTDFPQTNYENVFRFVCAVIGKVYKYDYTADSPVTYDSADGKLLRYTVYSAFEYLRTCALFTKLNAINSDIATDIISVGFVEKLFKEGTLDLMKDDFLFKAVTLVKAALPSAVTEMIDLDSLTGASLANVVSLLGGNVKGLLPTVAQILPALCDAEAGTVCGIDVDKLLCLEVVGEGDNQTVKAELYLDNIFKDLVFEAIGKDILR